MTVFKKSENRFSSSLNHTIDFFMKGTKRTSNSKKNLHYLNFHLTLIDDPFDIVGSRVKILDIYDVHPESHEDNLNIFPLLFYILDHDLMGIYHVQVALHIVLMLKNSLMT